MRLNQKLKVMVRMLVGFGLMVVCLLWIDPAQAESLTERLEQFPNWQSKPSVSITEGDLIYPDWMEGTWMVTSRLMDQVAPLAPDVVTPGMINNRPYINQPVRFRVRFQPIRSSSSTFGDRFLPFKTQIKPKNSSQDTPSGVVADRSFNGFNIAQAYLGDRAIRAVNVDPNSPNRQITVLSGGRQLISTVTGRGSETPIPDQFIATELTNQYFRGTNRPYFNQVETTTVYNRRPSPNVGIDALQITAVYLSPQDPDYFKALERPVALYRYQLDLEPES